MNRLNRYLIAGILMVAPLAITIYIGYQIVIRLDAQMHRLLPAPYATVPGLGFVVLIVALIFIGFITTGVIGKLINRSIDLALHLVPVPMVRSVYGTLRQMLEQIFSSSSSAFREVVMVEYPRKGVFALGFLSGEAYEACQVVHGMRLFNVFVPTTPNPTSGFLLLIPENEIIRTKLSVEEGIKLVVSSGIVHPEPASDPQQAQSNSEALAGQERPFTSSGEATARLGSKRVNGRLTVVSPPPTKQAVGQQSSGNARPVPSKPYQSAPSPALRGKKARLKAGNGPDVMDGATAIEPQKAHASPHRGAQKGSQKSAHQDARAAAQVNDRTSAKASSKVGAKTNRGLASEEAKRSNEPLTS